MGASGTIKLGSRAEGDAPEPAVAALAELHALLAAQPADEVLRVGGVEAPVFTVAEVVAPQDPDRAAQSGGQQEAVAGPGAVGRPAHASTITDRTSRREAASAA
ncbi:hypothetical protein IB60_17395 [Brucella abortus LMN1]|nr:hypothetical protein IB60_17395 [Brucella abortus LMN1]